MLLITAPQLKAQQILIPYRKGNLWGYADTTGKIVVTPQFGRADLFLDDFYYASVVNFTGSETHLGVIKNTGEIIIPPAKFHSYDLAKRACDYYSEQRTFLPLRLEKNKDRTYSGQQYWKDSMPVLFLAKIRNSYYGKDSIYLFDSTGKQLTVDPFEEIGVFSYVPLFYNFLVKMNNKFGVVDQYGKTVIPVEYDKLKCINEENGKYVIIAQKNGKSGLITMDNKIILPIKYDTIRQEFYDYPAGFILAVRKKTEEAVYDACGKLTEPFKPGKISVNRDYSGTAKQYRITREPILADAPYERVWDTDVAKEESKALIAVPDEAYNYSGQNKTAKNNNPYPQIFSENRLFGLKKGDSILIKPQYDTLYQLWVQNKGVYYIAAENGKKGIITEYNKSCIPVQFTAISQFYFHEQTGETFLKVTTQKGLSGLVTLDNKVIVPLKYFSIEKSEKRFRYRDVQFACSDATKTVFYKSDGTVLFTGNFAYAKPMLDDIDSLQQQIWMVKDGKGTAGVIDNNGTVIIKPLYKEVKSIWGSTNYRSQKFIIVKTAAGKQGLFSPNGSLLLPPDYDTIFSFLNQADYTKITVKADSVYYFVTCKNGLYGVTDMRGNIKLPHQYGSKFSFLYKGFPYIIVEKNKAFGIATFANPDFILPEENISFLLVENEQDKLNRGALFYKNTAVKDGNLGLYLIKEGKIILKIPARYKSNWGGRSSSVHRRYFSFLALDYIKDNQRFFDYVGYNGVLFFED